ncbi:MAG: Gfo/Idh/MocA family protein [Planktomarina sp.]
MNWGILGASKFAFEHMGPAIHAADGSELTAVASRSEHGGAAFQIFAPGCDLIQGYDTLLARDDIDAVYIPLPHTLHAEWSVKALHAGKHALTEKPIGMSVAEVDNVIKARDETGLIATEAYMIAHHPQWHRVRQMIADGAIGDVVHLSGQFSYDNSGDPKNIRNDQTRGGGALPDIGVYAMGAALMVMDAPLTDICARIRFEDGYDTFAQITGRIGQATYSGYVSMRMHLHQAFEIHGTKGLIRMTAPFNPRIFGEARIELHQDNLGLCVERFPLADQYKLQVEAFAAATQGADYPWPLEHACRTQQALDDIYAAATIL